MIDLLVSLLFNIINAVTDSAIQNLFEQRHPAKHPLQQPPEEIKDLIFVLPNRTPVECVVCRKNNEGNLSYCVQCGTELYEECPGCHKQKPRVENNCGFCGRHPFTFRQIDKFALKLQKKANWLSCGYVASTGVLWFSLLRLSLNIPVFVLVLCTISGIIAIGYEAFEEVDWQCKIQLRESQRDKKDVIVTRIENSYEKFFVIFTTIVLQIGMLTICALYQVLT